MATRDGLENRKAPRRPERLQPQLTAFIGERMRKAYEPVLQEPVPDRIARALDTLSGRGARER